MTWLFDTDGTYWVAVALLWMVAIVSIPVAFVVALTQVWRHREKRDGKR
jgi:heme/copper-type cytochrome/quinol oxidase subunit 2